MVEKFTGKQDQENWEDWLKRENLKAYYQIINEKLAEKEKPKT